LAEGETGSLLGLVAGKLSDMGLNIPAVNVFFYGLDYINAMIWNAGNKVSELNGNEENKNESTYKP
jgi:hypothetical protein